MASQMAPASQQVRTAMIAVGVAFAMLCLGFASVPLYRMFCEATGFGGTTQRGTEAELRAIAKSSKAGTGRIINVRFDSNVAQGMPWTFQPEKRIEQIRVGQREMAIFVAHNMSDKPVTGQASFNVTPLQSGAYFIKIQCFCFTEQTLQPGQTVRMPVLYYVDPKFLDDADNKDVQEITLSYTFYPVEKDDNQG
jgi:cytochrome c oxidase assembly protein subunit 11